MDSKAMFNISYGLFVVTANEKEKDNGCISNTVIQVTDIPLRISVTINKNSYTHGMIMRTGFMNVSILSQEAQFEIFRHWGFQTGNLVDKAVGIKFSRAENGIIYLTEGANAVLCGKVYNSIDLGSHTMFIADVTDAFCMNDTPSATYAYYSSNIKPKPAPSKKGWICTICGYIYEGETLPQYFVCPICQHPGTYFKKIAIM